MAWPAQCGLTPLEEAVLDQLLTDEHPVLIALRAQLSAARVKSREMSGVGFFTDFEWLEDAKPLEGAAKRIIFGDVFAELGGLEHGAGFILFIDDGFVSMFEGYTYVGDWPEEEQVLSFRYVPTPRDFASLDFLDGRV